MKAYGILLKVFSDSIVVTAILVSPSIYVIYYVYWLMDVELSFNFRDKDKLDGG